jgi:peptide/nickel transport system permease protein
MTTVDVEFLESGPSDEEPSTPETAKKIAGKSPTRIALERLRKDPVAIVCGAITGFLVLAALLAPVITENWPWGPISTEPNSPGTNLDPINGNLPFFGPPLHGFIWEHPLGIDPYVASDNLAQLLYGLRTDLFIGFAATVFSVLIGIVLGLMAGFSRGATDKAITFAIDVFLSFPFLLGALSIAPIITNRFASNQAALNKAQVGSLIIVLVLFGWMGLARLIRGYVISLREREFIQAAQVIGVPTRKILFKELLPNLVAPIVVSISLLFPANVIAEAGLSFLGLGITGSPSLGQTIARAQNYYQSYPLFLYAPVFVLMLIVLALNLLGDSVRDAFDPGTRR